MELEFLGAMKSIDFMWTSQCWAAIWISLQNIHGMPWLPWAVTAKSPSWRKPAWCKCVMESPTNINSVQPLQTNRTNSSYRHCLVFQRRRWGDLLMTLPETSSMIFACETVSWVFVWKQAMCLHNGRCHWHLSWIALVLHFLAISNFSHVFCRTSCCSQTKIKFRLVSLQSHVCRRGQRERCGTVWSSSTWSREWCWSTRKRSSSVAVMELRFVGKLGFVEGFFMAIDEWRKTRISWIWKKLVHENLMRMFETWTWR